MANKSIYVTMPTLAPLEEVTQLMQGIWERGFTGGKLSVKVSETEKF